MKKILFVDDEPRILEGLRNLLRRQRKQWDMVFAEGGKAALGELGKADFDVIVSDMRMPGMDGATLLKRVQEEHPRTVRIVLSGFTELEAALRAVPVAHQFLTKPCSADELVNVVDRACNLHGLVSDSRLQETIGHVDRLPPAPRMYSQLTSVLANPNATAQDVAKVLQQDVAMCAKLLQLVNSSFFTSRMPITDVEFAVVRLGLRMVKNLVMSVEVFQMSAPRTKGFSIEALQEHALLTAGVAQTLLPDKLQADNAFMAGLLHDIGKLIMACELPDQLETAIATATETREPLHVVENRLFGITHAEVGGYLLGMWGLPYPIVEAVAFHHVPARVATRAFDVLGAVHIADVLVGEALADKHEGHCHVPTPIDEEYVESLDLAGQLDSFRALAAERLGSQS